MVQRPVKNRPVLRSVAWGAVVLSLIGCNIFNPGGIGSSGELSLDGKIVEGESLLRDKKNSKAAQLFSEVLAEDSTRSKAYFGLAKAKLRQYEVDPFVLLDLLATFEDEKDPLALAVNFSAKLPPLMLEGMAETGKVLAPLIRRDSLQQLWRKKGTVTPPYRAKDYPLTDEIITWQRVNLDYQLLQAAETFAFFLSLRDLELNCIPFIDDPCDFRETALYLQALDNAEAREALLGTLNTLVDNLSVLDLLSEGMYQVNESGIIDGAGEVDLEDSKIQTNIEETVTSIQGLLGEFETLPPLSAPSPKGGR